MTEVDANRDLILIVLRELWEDLRSNNSYLWQLVAATLVLLTLVVDVFLRMGTIDFFSNSSEMPLFLFLSLSLLFCLMQLTTGMIAMNVKHRQRLLKKIEKEYSGMYMDLPWALEDSRVGQLTVIRRLPWFSAFSFWRWFVRLWLTSVIAWIVLSLCVTIFLDVSFWYSLIAVFGMILQIVGYLKYRKQRHRYHTLEITTL